jgi:Uncharacterized protein conserved in bacteria (DUF2252)
MRIGSSAGRQLVGMCRSTCSVTGALIAMRVGWTSFDGMDFYVRQFRDMKVVPDVTRIAPVLGEFATACGEVLARAHARTGDPVAIASYIGKGKRFDEAIGGFARAYADQTERDHAQLVTAIADGAVPAESG